MANRVYKLSCILYGHKSDVRSVCTSATGCIVSGSRDKSAKFWTPNEASGGYSESQTLVGHTNYVSSVCWLPMSQQHPEGLVLTGSNDCTIRAYVPDKPEAVFVLKGHSGTVCCLSRGVEAGTFASASWDMTARLWKSDGGQDPLAVLAEHQAAIWAVVQLEDSRTIVTGSADKSIKVWKHTGKCLRTLAGHTDCVRGLAAVTSKEFLSCANDATVRYWNAETGECITTIYGHTNFIYSVAVIGEESFVSSGEDRTVRVWERTDCIQTINLPAQSVWSVAVLPNKDIVAGSSDGVLRVFSTDPTRQADELQQKAFAEEVANSSAQASKELGGIKISDLPSADVLSEPGRQDGQTKLVREGSSVLCYSWSAPTRQWTKVGDVLGASGGTNASSGKQLYKGKEYDYVFSVDVEEGHPPLKLPYNCSEDAWVAAQRFIHEHGLSQLYLDQVANFITTNSRRVEPSAAAPAQFADPFTGGSRYVPGASSSAQTPGNGGESTVPYFPQKTFLRFDQANLQGILEKLQEFNAKLGSEISSAQLAAVVKLAEVGSAVDEPSLELLKRMLDWPQDVVFPVLDVARLAVRCEGPNAALSAGPSAERLVAGLACWLRADAPAACHMLALRLLANLFCHRHGQEFVVGHVDQLLASVRALPSPCNKNTQVALATVLLNLSVALEGAGNGEAPQKVAAVLAEVLESLAEPEAQFRAAVAVGTLLWNAPSGGEVHAAVIHAVLPCQPLLERWAFDGRTNAKVARCAEQLVALISL
ncbi:phospholipase A-2-activating protein [Bacillus rossius redtenbacheri]|uniref:phospholipase A-2-activating protein n=1 Tax=Bacillus rossius redtenbacheri TaxID=93214 RepID=UPI002FDF056E